MQKGIFFRVSCRPGDRAIAPRTVPTSRIKAYMKREEEALVQLGQAEQHMLAAVPPQHIAHWKCKEYSY